MKYNTWGMELFCNFIYEQSMFIPLLSNYTLRVYEASLIFLCYFFNLYLENLTPTHILPQKFHCRPCQTSLFLHVDLIITG